MKKNLTIVILALTFNAVAQIPTDSLELYFPFNGNALDQSGNGNDGSVYGATLVTDRFGNPNSAYSFDGIDDYIDLSSTLNLTGYNALTFSFWTNSDWTSNGHYIFDFSKTIGERLTIIYRSNSFQYMEIGFNDNYSFSYFANITSSNIYNQWTFFVVSIDYQNNNLIIYKNDTNVLNSAIDTSLLHEFSSTGDYKIGCRHDNTNFSPMTLDDIRIFSRVLTNSEITLLYNENITRIDEPNFHKLSIFPNPTNNNFTIDLGNDYNSDEEYSLAIVNALNQILYSTTVNTQQSNVELLNYAEKGMYFIILYDNTGNIIDRRKIVLQ